jgi:ribosome biogenesis GTPase / thiamine phosphate phosphatase
MKNNFIHHEESDFFNVRKDYRQERKRVSQKDRSKYKKTDQDQLKKAKQEEIPLDSLKRGIVLSIRPQQFCVQCEGALFSCSLRGSLKKETSKMKNLVIVGDYVRFEDIGSGNGVISSVEKRRSVLSRADNLSQQKEHLIAANVDQVFITVSVMDPPLRLPIIDRYLIAAAKGNLHPIIICNKIDLLDDTAFDETDREIAREALAECHKTYTAIGIEFIEVSSKTGFGIDKLAELMKDRISVFSGQSGSGKSSLINAITGLDLKVGRTVVRYKKGSHTTSFTQLLPLQCSGWCIDTPGIKSFGVWDLKEQDIRTYFTEICAAGSHCKFPDCRHRGEPGCSVPALIEEGAISQLRYNSYLSLLEGIKLEHLRR